MQHIMTRAEIITIAIFFAGDDALDTQDGYAPFRGANLEDANLEDANLEDANLEDANLRGANLINANLEDANLRGANLRGANLRGADLRDADLRDADLRGADLRDADLIGANLIGANLRDADLRGADLIGANLIGANLNGTLIASIYVPGMSSRGDALRAYRVDADGKAQPAHEQDAKIIFRAGCFTGDADALRQQVKRSKGDSAAASLYLAAIDLILLAFPQPEQAATTELDSVDRAV